VLHSSVVLSQDGGSAAPAAEAEGVRLTFEWS
jgi:hypothetical protein